MFIPTKAACGCRWAAATVPWRPVSGMVFRERLVFFTGKRPSRDPFSPGRLLQTHSSQCQWVKHRLGLRVFGLLAVLGGSELLHVKACVYLSLFWRHPSNTRICRVEHKPPESRMTKHNLGELQVWKWCSPPNWEKAREMFRAAVPPVATEKNGPIAILPV